LEHEILRETVEISLDGLVENFVGDAVKLREIGIQQDFLLAQDMDERRDIFGNEKDRAFPGRGFILVRRGNSWMKSTRFAPGVQCPSSHAA
jgi:hypothetical protein